MAGVSGLLRAYVNTVYVDYVLILLYTDYGVQ